MKTSLTQNRIELSHNKTCCVGDHLYLVAGSKRWCLYDLLNETLTTIDNYSAETIITISSQEISPSQKKQCLKQDHLQIWECAKEAGITDRLFESDTSIPPDSIPMDILWLEVTDQCNEQCIHCYEESSPQRKTSMPLDLVKSIIKQGSELRFDKLQITGGEPFLHKDIYEILRYACSFNFPIVEIFTNLTLLNNSDLELIRSLSIKIATTLLGSVPSIHDACTRTPGSFRRWYANIEKVQQMGIDFRIGVVRMRQNETDMKNIEKFLRDKDLLKVGDHFNPDDVRPMGRGKDQDIQPSSIPDCEPNLKATPKFFHLARIYNPCWRGELCVSTSGTVHPCVFSKKLTAGDLTRESLAEVVTKLTKSYWSITLDRVDRCKDCELRYACMDCRALCLNSKNGLFGAQPRCNYNPYLDDE